MSDTPHRNRLIRQVRQMRLLGKPVAEIAGIVGLHRATVYKLIQRNGLDGPEEWMERPRLALQPARLAAIRQVAHDAWQPSAHLGRLKQIAAPLVQCVVPNRLCNDSEALAGAELIVEALSFVTCQLKGE